ncbi:MAG: 16S rRNA (guanine(966)-N(2))-methyltransferase RsmD [Sandaracinus sp.]|nr:16S rRNA (guanine(966)-N(2))-methyltransferase RsmD [Sandaracinus sp.]|tara:strand:+ start:688 stop:1236 length:549 start_codon:yes stop_codon:yes gene_type:complete
MRIVGGALKGRRFPAPKGRDTRPTSDRVREALASALEARGAIARARVLDGFAGTGALGFEALSRGAESAVLVDTDPKVRRGLEASAAALELSARVTVRRDDMFGAKIDGVLDLGPFHLVFLDPPYARVPDLGPLLAALVPALAEDALVVVERDRRDALPEHPLRAVTSYRYGDTAVDLLSRA